MKCESLVLILFVFSVYLCSLFQQQPQLYRSRSLIPLYCNQFVQNYPFESCRLLSFNHLHQPHLVTKFPLWGIVWQRFGGKWAIW